MKASLFSTGNLNGQGSRQWSKKERFRTPWELVSLPVVTVRTVAFSRVPFISGMMEKIYEVAGLKFVMLMLLSLAT